MDNLTGKRFGRLVVVALLSRNPAQTYYAKRWACVCDCGERREVFTQSLKSGATQSCGCQRRERAKENIKKARGKGRGNLQHGGCGSPEYGVWADMRKRCRTHVDYAGRGIKVCARWESFENFLADMGKRPDGLTLDRINNAGNYEPGNCRWASRKEQARNRRSSSLITAFGKTQPLQTWADERGINHSTIRMRLRRGWTAERALSI